MTAFVERHLVEEAVVRVPCGEWFVLETVAGQEERLCSRLSKRGAIIWVEEQRRWAELGPVEPWAPSCTVRRVTRRGVTKTEAPLFRGYVFVRLDLASADIAAIEAAKGAIGFMRHYDQPWPLLDNDVRQLREIAARKGGIIIDAATGREMREWNDLPTGSPVKITGGVWQGWNGLYSERINGRIQVLLDLFGRATKTLIAEALVVPA